MSETVVVADHLAKTYRVGFLGRRVEAVKDVSFEVRAGEVFGLLGPNGAGKTTTMKMLLGFVAPTKGTATVAGLPAGSTEARRRFGYLPENPALYEFLRGDELLVTLAKLSGLGAADAKRRAGELLELVGLAGRGVDRPIRKFSKGMVQRLAIAQALITDPPIVLLDEPMSGLDPVGRKEIRDLIFALRDKGTTVFFSTHILPDVEAICDRIGIVTGGRMSDYGTLEELLEGSSGRYEVVLRHLPDGFTATLKSKPDTRVVEREGALVIDVPDRASGEQLLRDALGTGAQVVSFQANRGSLEALFVKRADEQKAGVAAGSVAA